MKKRILIIDDDIDMCALLSRFLAKNGYETETSHTGNKGLEKFKETDFDIVLCDYRLGDKKDGKDILMEIKKIKPSTIVLIITGYSDIKTAVDVIRAGAYDYITKPLIPDEILNVLSKAINQPEEEAGAAIPPSKDNKTPRINGSAEAEFLEGVSPTAKELYKQIDLVAPRNFSIILYGESGTGKEV